MALKLLVDECIEGKQLVERLRHAGHDTVTVTDIGLVGASDQTVFESAIVEDRVVLTTNVKDYAPLGKNQTAAGLKYPGVLWVPRNGEGMSNQEIVDAIARIEITYPTLEDQIVCVNKSA